MNIVGVVKNYLLKIKKWISKQKPPFNTILKYLFSYIEKWYWDGKVLETMAGVDLEVKKLHEQWDKDDKQITPHIVEKGVFGDEGWSIEITNPIVERGIINQLAQAWLLGAMHQDYKKMKGIKEPPSRESGYQTTMKEFFARWK